MRHAAECARLANEANTDEGRTRWLNMKQFWMRRVQLDELNPPSNSAPTNNIVEI